MDFTFSEDQLLFAETVRDFLAKECTPDQLRDQAETETGRSDTRWAQLTEMGLPGMLVPEGQGGLGFSEVDFVLLAEACGRAALPEPLVDSSAIAAQLLARLKDERAQSWLSRLADGSARAAIGHPRNPFVADAHFADLLILERAGEVHLVASDETTLVRQPSIDPLRHLFKVEWPPSADTKVADAETGQPLWDAALNRGALFAAAQCAGLANRMTEMAVAYVSERKQFGQVIGAFQAVKHHLASVAVKTEFAKPVIYRAAYSIANNDPDTDAHVSHAKLAACEAAELAAKTAIQCHGAMGYTAEVNLHLWMKRTWALQGAWGDKSFHLARVDARVLQGNKPVGPGETFGSVMQ